MESYEYSALGENEIRLVSIAKAENGELEASIRHVDLNPDDPLKYTALSYCWGDQTHLVNLPCDGKQLRITPSLYEALGQITSFSPHSGLWIDQICIDQKDNADKSQQIVEAETVLAWLGPSTPSTALAIDMVNTVGKIALPTASDMFLWDTQGENEEHEARKLEQVEEYSLENSVELGIPFDDLPSWNAFSDFFDKSWFQRMWTVQEIIQARKAIVVCGSYSVPWEHVSAAARWFCYKAKAIHDRNKRSVNGMCMVTQMVAIPWRSRAGSEYLGHLLGQKMRPTYRWGLRDLLERLRPRKAGDDRDKVYGVLGISEIGNSGRVPVDYSLSVQDVFTRATGAIIESDPMNDFSVLWSARQRCDEPGWPSWVPDWRMEAGYGCEYGVGKPFNTGRKVNGRHRHIPTTDPAILAVQGKILGEVTWRSPFSHLGELFSNSGLRLVYQEVMDRLPAHANGDDVRKVFGLTIVGGHFSEALVRNGIQMETYVDKFMGFFDVTQMSRATPDDVAIREKALNEYYALGFDAGWLQAILDTCCERRLVTMSGNQLGLAHHKVQEGDLIAIIVGLDWPCVLRPKGSSREDGFEFVGDAYVHGMMNGEGVADLPMEDGSENTWGCYLGEKFLLV